MLSKQRQDKILDILREKGKISFTDLAKKLNTSYATIRRDCENLESFNLVTRISKGVELNEYKYDIDISYRQVKNISKKMKNC
ncbi:DeoR family transcriptional regulator [Sneathia vaginalis]|uniref:DeoR family transcriptional regulator n=1 Tax=Sneathia vaginalis TaxID=187101 RepID=UPI00254C89AC|nr:DeoR family transcriptional regulator [Sneathia vaginalis]MDK9581685.1 DeoR family transcriptional regulator [Sneathia vaginalis]